MEKMAKSKKFSTPLTVFLAIVCLIAGCVVGFLGAAIYDAMHTHSDEAPQVMVEGELQIHFLELGNKYTGDCTYIKAGDTDILIDAGSRTTSIETISSYIDQYVTDKTLEYVIVTHAHQDHYAGFTKTDGSLFDLYKCENIIDFGTQTNQEEKGTNMYSKYLAERNAEIDAGANYLPAPEHAKESFDLGSGVEMIILDSYYYYNDAPSENDYSVCTLFTYGSYKYLFTGDLEEDGEKQLISEEYNDPDLLKDVYLYKAGHHGSKTSSSAEFLEVISPEVVCVCCCAGSSEYTKINENTFPTQQFIDRIALYTDRVYVTTLCEDYDAGTFVSMNGNIIVSTTAGGVEVICSNDSRVLKEWEWFKDKRIPPNAWKS
jgi:competence protein ComEC